MDQWAGMNGRPIGWGGGKNSSCKSSDRIALGTNSDRGERGAALRRPASRFLCLLVQWAALMSLQYSWSRTALASPPVDYFVYTSQMGPPKAASQNVSSILAPLDSIYAPDLESLAPNASSSSSLSDDERAQLVARMSARVLALVTNSSHRHDNDLSDLETTRFAWNLMEKQALTYMKKRVSSLRPAIEELLSEARVSRACSNSINLWLNELVQLKQWAALMWNSWGQFPMAGLFQGSYTDLGSYSSCMSIEDNELIGQPQYCMLDLQPIVPARPRFHSIFKRVLGYDARRQQLTAGDFEHLMGSAQPTGSRLSAHGVASARYKELHGTQAPHRHPAPQLSEEERLLLAALAGADADAHDGTPDSARHSKRTILLPSANNSRSSDERSGDSAALAAPSSVLAELGQNSSEQLNLTLKTEALVELALKAQYFYYVKFRIGACLPSKCSSSDVSKLTRAASRRAILQALPVNCMKKEPFSLNNYQLVAICILTVLALIAILGAIVDLLGFKEGPNSAPLVNWLLPFSIWTNAKRLFDLQAAGTHSDLECVHGLRFFSMLWVIYGHTILYTEYQSFTHFYDVIETQIPSFLLLPSLNANFSVDTFFVISGILTTYVTWEYMDGDVRKFNKFAFMVSRYIRLTPQLAIVILCFFLLPLFGEGPLYKQVAEEQAQLCYKNWPINLLYLQSYIEADKLCIDPSWWLSIEMTFHVISALVIIVMIQDVRRGMWVNLIVASLLMLWGATIHYTHGMAIQYLPSIPQRFEVAAEQTKLFFHRPYPHAAAYFIGIALGYVLANKTIKKLPRSRLLQGWTACALCLVVSLWGSYFWNLGAPYSQLAATLYYNLCQILWPAAIAWIILACSLGHGGFVNSILSARLFVPLGRITYMTYLSHSLIIYYHSARMSITMEPSMMLFTYLFIANTALALALGIVLTVVYESPILALQKQLYTYLTQKFNPTTNRSAAKANGNSAPFAPKGEQTVADEAATILMDEQNTLLANGASRQMNGFQSNKNGSMLATCLVLDSNNAKQSRRPSGEAEGRDAEYLKLNKIQD